jgi:hypothetical protein
MTGNDLIEDISNALIELDIDESDTELISEIAIALVALGVQDGDAG